MPQDSYLSSAELRAQARDADIRRTQLRNIRIELCKFSAGETLENRSLLDAAMANIRRVESDIKSLAINAYTEALQIDQRNLVQQSPCPLPTPSHHEQPPS
jgi:hypothetical protein